MKRLLVLLIILLYGISPRGVFAEEVRFGWDFNEGRKCIKSTDPLAVNYFQDTTDCSQNSNNWTIAVQSEHDLGVSCAGVDTQSLPINTSQSPVSFQMLPHTDEFGRRNWSANLKTDVITTTHPCGAGAFTWYVLMDKIGPFPQPENLVFQSTVSFADSNPQGSIRAFALAQVFYDDSNDGIVNPKAHSIEIAFSHSSNWGDNFPQDYRVWYDNNPEREYIYIDGTQLGTEYLNFNGQVVSNFPKSTAVLLTVNWYAILTRLLNDHYLTPPINSIQNSAVGAVAIGTESNNFTSTQSVLADLWVTNFRIMSRLNPVEGDLDADAKRTVHDESLLLQGFYGSTTTGDMSLDKTINALDFTFLQKNLSQ